jgi:hypothetical protein
MIKEAQSRRYKVSDEEQKKEAILISDKWMEDLMKHPYYSSNQLVFHICRETWYWYLLDERESKSS